MEGEHAERWVFRKRTENAAAESHRLLFDGYIWCQRVRLKFIVMFL